MRNFLIILMLNILFVSAGYSQSAGTGQTTPTVNRRQSAAQSEALRREKERQRRAMQEYYEKIYHPPFHLGINLGLGITGTKAPSDHEVWPKLGAQVNIITTYHFSKHFGIYGEVGWSELRGLYRSATGRIDYTLDYFTVKAAPLIYYKEGFIYVGIAGAFKLKDKQTLTDGTEPIFSANSMNIGITAGGGWRIDFLNRIRMVLSFSFDYYFGSWIDAPSKKWQAYGFFFNIGIMFGIGKYKAN